jgi:DNA-binding transcriptional ArsR family regulator
MGEASRRDLAQQDLDAVNREKVLDVLRDAGQPLFVADIARRTGMGPSAVGRVLAKSPRTFHAEQWTRWQILVSPNRDLARYWPAWQGAGGAA